MKKREVGDEIGDETLLRKIIGTKPFNNVLFVKPSSVSVKRRAWEITTDDEKVISESDFSSSCSSVVKCQRQKDGRAPSKKIKVASPVFYKLVKFLNPFCLYDNTLGTGTD